MTDVNHYFDIQISASHIFDLRNIIIYHEEQKVFDIRVIFKDTDQITNYNDTPIKLKMDYNKEYFGRLFFRGNNMVFQKGPNYVIMHFDEVHIHFNLVDQSSLSLMEGKPILIEQS